MDFFRSIMIHQQEKHSFLNEDTMHLLHFFLYMPSKSNKTQPRFGILDAKNIDPGLLSLDHVTHRKPGTGNVVIPHVLGATDMLLFKNHRVKSPFKTVASTGRKWKPWGERTSAYSS